jgi:quercetin dioxygenase-like cupin family protein
MMGKGRIRLTLSILLAAVACYRGAAGAVDGAKATQTRAAITQAMPPLNGASLKVSIVEVTYAPGAESRPHTHPCPVIGYVVSGHYRSGVKGGEERVYAPGETFYEAPNGVHVVSRNASGKEPTKFLAYFLCDHDVPLSTNVSDGGAHR